MIYMVEMDLIDRARRADWDKWYMEHTKMLLTFPGFHATQRFECIHQVKAPFVALHHVDGSEFFESPIYRSNAGPAGTGEWRRKMNNWSRNLFAGLETTPNINNEEYLILAEGIVKKNKIGDLKLVWIESVGLDKDVKIRGLGCTRSKEVATGLTKLKGVRVLRPLNKRLTEVDLLF